MRKLDMGKVLIYGGGKRISQNIIPSFSIMDTKLNIEFVTRSGSEKISSDKIKKCFKFGTSDIDHSVYDFIIISVPQNEVLSVLKSIKNIDKFKILLDTPITREIYMRYKNSSIKVMEDMIYLPFLEDIKSYGDINEVIMTFSGYEYHGVAFIKALFDKKIVKSKRTRNETKDEVTLLFKEKKLAKIINPRDYKKGYVEIIFANHQIMVFGNKETYENMKKSSDFINGEMNFKYYIDGVPNKNFINSLDEFKKIGLSTIFNKALNSNYENLPNIKTCYQDYKIVNSITIKNRFKWKINKIRKNL